MTVNIYILMSIHFDETIELVLQKLKTLHLRS